jgi:hypothetical protein
MIQVLTIRETLTKTSLHFIWHKGIQKPSQPGNKPKPQLKTRHVHLDCSAQFRKAGCPWSPEIENSSKKNWSAGGMAQVVEHLPSQCKTLGSVPSTTKRRRRTRERRRKRRRRRTESLQTTGSSWSQTNFQQHILLHGQLTKPPVTQTLWSSPIEVWSPPHNVCLKAATGAGMGVVWVGELQEAPAQLPGTWWYERAPALICLPWTPKSTVIWPQMMWHMVAYCGTVVTDRKAVLGKSKGLSMDRDKGEHTVTGSIQTQHKCNYISNCYL